MKMYILIKDSVPDELAPVIAAHASLACYRKYEMDPDMKDWVAGIFKKVICRVNQKEFKRAGMEEKYVLLTESALNDQEVALAFCPREDFPKTFKFFRKWQPNCLGNQTH